MGNDESYFNVSLIVQDKVTRQLSINQNLFEEKEPFEGPRPFCLLLGQTGLQVIIYTYT